MFLFREKDIFETSQQGTNIRKRDKAVNFWDLLDKDKINGVATLKILEKKPDEFTNPDKITKLAKNSFKGISLLKT